MNPEKRSVKQYSFKNPDTSELRKLGALVLNSDHFKNRYGSLLSLLKIQVEKGILETLIQFYDSVYHCFTFPDYQLVPTLEEYSYLVGLPVSDKIPLSGLEDIPKKSVIAEAFHLKISDVKNNLTFKRGF